MKSRLARMWPSTPGAWALAALLLVAVALRALALAGTWPAILAMHDSAGYVRAAHTGLSHGAQEPSGYPIFLRALHTLSHQLAVAITIQHLLGLAAGGLLYAAVRRFGTPVWVALVPAAVVWLNGDQIYLEQTPLSETVFTFVLAFALYAIARCRAEGSRRRWGALAAAAIALLPMVRSVGVPLVPLLGLFLLLALWGERPARLARLGVAAAVGLVLLAAYAGVRHHSTGHWALTAEGGGWNLYARAAPFADCHRFKPPVGTRVLCESSPAGRRPGPGIYHWYPNSPAIRAYGEPPAADRQVGRFALAAMVQQPLDYAGAVLSDLVRYVDPSARHPKLGDGSGGTSISFRRASDVDLQAGLEARAYYAPWHAHSWGAGTLRAYQSLFRVHGWLVALLLAFALAGAAASRPSARWPLLMFAVCALALFAFPAAVGGATWRYAIPPDGLLAAAAGLGVAELVVRARAFERRRGPAARKLAPPLS